MKLGLIIICPLCEGDTENADTCLYREDGMGFVSDRRCVDCDAQFQEEYIPDDHNNCFDETLREGTNPFMLVDNVEEHTVENVGDYDLYSMELCRCGIWTVNNYTFKESIITDKGNTWDYNLFDCKKHGLVKKALKTYELIDKTCPHCDKDLKKRLK